MPGFYQTIFSELRRKRDASLANQTAAAAEPPSTTGRAAYDLGMPSARPSGRDLNSSPEDLGRLRQELLNDPEARRKRLARLSQTQIQPFGAADELLYN